MANRKRPRRPPRYLPPPPEGADFTASALVMALLRGFGATLPDEFNVVDEARTFLTLMEQDYPAAMKDYVEHHLIAVFSAELRIVEAKKRKEALMAAAAERVRLHNGGEPSGKAIVSVFDTSNSIGGGWYKRLRTMNRLDLAQVAASYRQQAASRLRWAELCDRLGDRMSDDEQTVSDAWSDEELAQLQEEVLSDTYDDEETT